ncbi:G-protein coupled receptors family 1 profile domain-containing protein [Caenorhabditis elegans]|uniref:G-protein coupled receptors family 1 profile domain-containing protein n=1 Tax=Caenorhabditis elegans TaxID=6239 RepID=Q94295_CAEEL|nr:G-protein coupled receptors family 1 profile domain-containing protein [Caenorhabditis elegans]CCD83394.2 G-protein coupled receptors family 1 profile domain-containing protein [Caenorhabditis elegans]|eukprot:NP_001309513.1 Serpentine Receptor, class X [Caenorhabditis elegans]
MQDPQFVGMSLFPISLFGMALNWCVTVILIREKTTLSSFMILTLVKSFFDAIYLTVYFLYITPMIIFASQLMIYCSHWAGYVLIVCYEISIHTHFLSSVNRFIAVFFPFSYKNIFSPCATKIYITAIAIFSFTMMTTVIFGFGCRLEYRPETWVSFYDVTITICAWYAYYVDFLKNLVVVFTDAIIDIITLLKIQKMRKQYRNGKRSENYTKKETDFLKQTLGQALCYLMCYTSYLMVPEMMSNRYVAFFMSLI